LGDTTSLVPGFPIRTSSDPRSVDSSPRHIAASHVLHRLPVPRHPPCALKHLHTKQIKKYSRKNKKKLHHHATQPPTPKRGQPAMSRDARNHYPQIKHHTPPPKQGNNTPHPLTGTGITSGFPHSGRRDDGPVVSKPNSVSGNPSRPHPPKRDARRPINVCCAPEPHPLQAWPIFTNRLRSPNPHTMWAGLKSRGAP
jgi:hypothetical protein